MRRVFAGSRYANVTSTLALAIALGGTSYAAIKLPSNSVGTKQIKAAAVTSAKVKNRSLKAVDFRLGEMPRGAQGLAGATGAAGARGAAGEQGALGPTGAIGPSATYERIMPAFYVPIGAADTSLAVLPNLPAGSYSVDALAALFGNAGGNYLACDILANDASIEYVQATPHVAEYQIVLQGSVESAGPLTLKLVCNTYGGAGTTAVNFGTSLKATRVGSLVRTAAPDGMTP
jgi:hypothetical protein